MARRRLFYFVVRALATYVRWSPRWLAGASMAGLGWCAWVSRPGDRACALRQLELAFPQWDARERRSRGRHSFVLFGRNLVDAVRRDVALTLDSADEERLERAQASGRPLLILTAHLGCFELLGRFLARRLPPLGVITADPHNHWVGSWLRKERTSWGMVPFDRRDHPLAAARWLRSGHPLAVLADHRNAVRNVMAPWFGVLAPTAVGPARLAKRADACVVPIGICRSGTTHRVLVGEPLQLDPRTDDADSARRCNEALEALVRRAPQEWTWFHNRYGGDTLPPRESE